MAVTRAIRTLRQTLVAGVLTEIRAPVAFTQCMVGNLTGADLKRYTNDDLSANEYRVIPAGYERLTKADKLRGFRHDETAFWLLSAGGGEVILEWT